jgi:acyl-CoA synthetase (AMP-forming)/AMP-acid ligase II
MMHIALQLLPGSTEVSADATCQVISSSLLASLQGPWVPAGHPIDNMMLAVGRTDSSSSSDSSGSGRERRIGQPGDQQQPADNPAATAAPAAATDTADGKRNGSSSSKEGLLVPLPVGCEGEVWVAGPGLAAGYLAQSTADVKLQQQEQRFQELQLQLQDLHQTAGFSTNTATGTSSSSTDMQQQQRVSVAAGLGAYLAAAASQQQVWFRTGDLGRMLPDGECGWITGTAGALTTGTLCEIDLMHAAATCHCKCACA